MLDFKFDWDPKLETHIETLDTQRKQLFSIGRDVEQLIQTKCIDVQEQSLLDIVCRLREYVTYNSYEEENMMTEISYDKIKEHKEEHKKFINSLMKIDIPKMKEEPLKTLIKTQDMIVDYVFSHLLKEDIEMTKEYVRITTQNKMQKPLSARAEKKILTEEEKRKEEIYGYKICNLDVTEVFLYKDQTHKGEVVAVYKGNVKRLIKLTAFERSAYFSDIDRIGKVLQEIYTPDTISYAAYEDVEEQLGFHIVPKKQEDKDWKKVYIPQNNESMYEEEEYDKIIEVLKAKLVH